MNKAGDGHLSGCGQRRSQALQGDRVGAADSASCHIPETDWQ